MDNHIVELAIKHSSEVIDESLMSQDELGFMLKLEAYIAHLLQHDFNALVNLLCKMLGPTYLEKASSKGANKTSI